MRSSRNSVTEPRGSEGARLAVSSYHPSPRMSAGAGDLLQPTASMRSGQSSRQRAAARREGRESGGAEQQLGKSVGSALASGHQLGQGLAPIRAPRTSSHAQLDGFGHFTTTAGGRSLPASAFPPQPNSILRPQASAGSSNTFLPSGLFTSARGAEGGLASLFLGAGAEPKSAERDRRLSTGAVSPSYSAAAALAAANAHANANASGPHSGASAAHAHPFLPVHGSHIHHSGP